MTEEDAHCSAMLGCLEMVRNGTTAFCDSGARFAAELNAELFTRGAAILKGTDCDMARRGGQSPLRQFFRFSFGPLKPESFDSDIEILGQVLR